jgi:hypothetical protein
MNVSGERVLVFGDSLSHHGADAAPEIWDVDEGSSRTSGQPGDLLASLLLEQGAMAARVNARVGRSAFNFWGRENTQGLLASDQAFAPTKVIVILGTNDLGVAPQKTADAMLAIKRAYEAMGAQVWAIGPVTYNDATLNARAPAVIAVMQGVFGSRFIDGRPLSVQTNRAGDGVHFGASSARETANNMAAAVLRAGKLAMTFATAIGALAIVGATWWAYKRHKAGVQLHGIDEKLGRNLHNALVGISKGIYASYGANDRRLRERGLTTLVDGRHELTERGRLYLAQHQELGALPDGYAKRHACHFRDVDPAQLKQGTKIEHEHTRDRSIARRIALDHLCEDPNYYHKLATVHLDDGDSASFRGIIDAHWTELPSAELEGRDPDYSPEMQFKHIIREPGVDAMDVAEDLLLENGLKISKVAANADGDAGNLDIHPMGAADTPINRVSWRADRKGPDAYESFVTVMWNNKPLDVRPSQGAPYSEHFLKRLQIANGSKSYAMKWGAAAAWQIARELKRLPPDTKPEIVTEIIDRWNRQEHPDLVFEGKHELYGLQDLAGCKGLNAEQISESIIAAGKHQAKTTKEGKAINEAGFGEQLANVIKYTARNAAGPIVADIEDANEDDGHGD